MQTRSLEIHELSHIVAEFVSMSKFLLKVIFFSLVLRPHGDTRKYRVKLNLFM